MATAIPFQQTSVGTGLQAPDLTKAGNIFADALKGLSKNVSNVAEKKVDDAQNLFSQQLMSAKKGGDFSGVSLDPLQAVGANAEELSAAEAALRSGQLDVLGRKTNEAFENQLANNKTALEASIARLAQENPALSGIVSLDPSATLQFDTAGGKFKDKDVAKAKDILASYLQDPNTGFVGVNNPRESLAFIRKQVRELGGSDEDAAQLHKRFQSFQQGFTELAPEEQALVAAQHEAADRQHATALVNLDAHKRAQEVTAGMSTDAANKLINTSKEDVYNWVKTDVPTNYDWKFWKGSGGAEAKAIIREYLEKGALEDGTKVLPWMVQRAMLSVAETDPDSLTFRASAFRDSLAQIAKNRDYNQNLANAAMFDVRYKQDRNTLDNELAVLKTSILNRFKRDAGIRDANFNRSIADRRIGEELARLEATRAQPGQQARPAGFVGDTVPRPPEPTAGQKIASAAGDAVNLGRAVVDDVSSINLPPELNVAGGFRALGSLLSDTASGVVDRVRNSNATNPLQAIRDVLGVTKAEAPNYSGKAPATPVPAATNPGTLTPDDVELTAPDPIAQTAAKVDPVRQREIATLVAEPKVDVSIPANKEIQQRAAQMLLRKETNSGAFKILQQYLSGKTPKQIAQALQMPESGVKKILGLR